MNNKSKLTAKAEAKSSFSFRLLVSKLTINQKTYEIYGGQVKSTITPTPGKEENKRKEVRRAISSTRAKLRKEVKEKILSFKKNKGGQAGFLFAKEVDSLMLSIKDTISFLGRKIVVRLSRRDRREIDCLISQVVF